MRLYLVRHLAPQVAPSVCYGRTDLAVDPDMQALALPALRAALPAGMPLFSSPLRRCADLAAALGGAAVRYDARLAELDFGEWEMRRWDDIDRAGVDAWAADMAGYRPGGGESVADMARRVSAFHADCMRLPAPGAIVICHAGTIRLLSARARGLAPEAMALEAAQHPHAIAYGETVIIDCV
ncbi:histidine phosphatase family protein [Massilia antarctica]|uniref:Histidine phosphatase family protein n=1 Tax=Massilia antarctica TaxID=2765360 RepID=A0AA48WGE0_9BURK|nr:histidine phosphatase family protein [Massilia antarctica]QPI52230.1 histidine phosphatase family protein [Massilia antarctica]